MALTHSASRASSFRARHGLSYLEVLMASGIALAGILGAVALFPVAAYYLNQGQVADTMNAVGESAANQADIIGIRNTNNWVGYDPVTVPAFQPVPITAVCIDPRMVAGHAPYTDIQLFPAVAPSTGPSPWIEARMQRISLRQSAINGNPMGLLQARQLFQCSDDLIFERTDDANGPLPAQQLWTPAAAGQSSQLYIPPFTQTRRDYTGNFEWIATLVPKLNGTVGPTGEYVLSVVVLNRRPANLSLLPAYTDGPDAVELERVANVVQFYSNGIGGGDVQIRSTRRSRSDISVSVDDWVMLSGIYHSTPDLVNMIPPQPAGPLFQWYRVTSIQSDENAIDPDMDGVNDYFQRDITLEGADWPYDVDPNKNQIPNGTQITLVSGVVGVFQRTIRLESSDRW